MEKRYLEVIDIKKNSLIVDKFSEPVHTIEEGIARIKEIKQDYERIVEAVTERKFYLEGKTLSEIKAIESRGRTGTWIATYEKMGYTKQQVETLLRKYEVANNLIGVITPIMTDKIDRLTIKETKQLADMELEKQKALLESENLKAELKALREQVRKEKEEAQEEYEVLEAEKERAEEKLREQNTLSEELEETVKLFESEITRLSRELNSRPTIEKEILKEVVKEVEKEVIPEDYVRSKEEVERYKAETERRNKELVDLKAKLEKVKEDNKWKVKELEFKLTTQNSQSSKLMKGTSSLFDAVQMIEDACVDDLKNESLKNRVAMMKPIRVQLEKLMKIIERVEFDGGDYIEIA